MISQPCYRKACQGLPPHPHHQVMMATTKNMLGFHRFRRHYPRYRRRHYWGLRRMRSLPSTVADVTVNRPVTNISKTIKPLQQSQADLLNCLLRSRQFLKEPCQTVGGLDNKSESGPLISGSVLNGNKMLSVQEPTLVSQRVSSQSESLSSATECRSQVRQAGRKM